MVTGVISFDISGMADPISECVEKMQNRLHEEKLVMLKQLRRDPVPQFKTEEIAIAIRFLAEAVASMQAFIDDFSPSALKGMDTKRLKAMQEKARESARQLLILFGDCRSEFSGSELQWGQVRIRESSQSHEIKERLTTLRSLLQTFGDAQWLGSMVVDGHFERRRKLSLDILGGLIAPQMAALPDCEDAPGVMCEAHRQLQQIELELSTLQGAMPCTEWTHCQNPACGRPVDGSFFCSLQCSEAAADRATRVEQLNEQKAYLQNLVTQIPQHLASALSDAQQQMQSVERRLNVLRGGSMQQNSRPLLQQLIRQTQDLSTLIADLLRRSHEARSQGRGNGGTCKACAQQQRKSKSCRASSSLRSKFSALSSDADAQQTLQCLIDMCTHFQQILTDDGERTCILQKHLEHKMCALRSFAEILNRIPKVLNQYILLRLGDVGMQELSVLKNWVTHEEATKAHRLLEAFRDNAIYERAVRETLSESGSNLSWHDLGADEVASAKGYLFDRSVGYSGEVLEEPDEWNEESAGPSPTSSALGH